MANKTYPDLQLAQGFQADESSLDALFRELAPKYAMLMRAQSASAQPKSKKGVRRGKAKR